VLGSLNCCRVNFEALSNLYPHPADQLCLIFSAQLLSTAPANEDFGKSYATRLKEEISKGEGVLKIPAAL
jgi:hypothetical protein